MTNTNWGRFSGLQDDGNLSPQSDNCMHMWVDVGQWNDPGCDTKTLAQATMKKIISSTYFLNLKINLFIYTHLNDKLDYGSNDSKKNPDNLRTGTSTFDEIRGQHIIWGKAGSC